MPFECPRIVLIGLGSTTATALESLAERFEVIALVREAHDETTRHATAMGIRVHTDVSLKTIDELVCATRPDCVVVSSFNRILPARLIAKSAFINVHYAALPSYRGRANVNWALINGEATAGITIHTIESELDAGNILYQHVLPILDSDTVADVYERLNAVQRATLGQTVQRFFDGERGVPQDSRAATYCCTRLPEDGEIDWSAPTVAIDRLVRALVRPYPGAYTYVNGELVRVWRAAPVVDAPHYVGRVPGRVVARSKMDGSIDVLTGDGILRLFELQPEMGACVAAAECITSVRTTLGLSKRDLLARIRELECRVGRAATPSSGPT